MRIPMNLLLVNLAVADMTVAVFIAIRYIFILMFTLPSGKVGDAICKLVMFMWVGAYVSAFSLVCISLERYLTVKFPYNKHKRITTAKLKRAIVVIWVWAVTWSMPNFLYTRYDSVKEFCVTHWPNVKFHQFHSLATAIVYGVLTITIMIYLYSNLVYKLWFRPTPGSTLAQQRKLIYCKKTARLVVTVSAIYCVCWIPVLVIHSVLSLFTSLQPYSSMHATAVALITLNSAINPVLYSLQSDRFRQHMLALLPFSRCSRRSCRVLPANVVTPTDEVSVKMAGLPRAKTLPLESRGPTR